MSARLAVAALLATLALVAGCSSSSGSSQPPAAGGSTSGSSPASANPVLTATASSKATILTVGGRTVYRFDPDTATSSACTGGCAALWPPVSGSATAGSGVAAASLGTITRPDGSTQRTYAGHPLYTYAGDSAAGQTNGDGVGGKWHLVTVSGGPAPASSSSSKAGGGNGYGY